MPRYAFTITCEPGMNPAACHRAAVKSVQAAQADAWMRVGDLEEDRFRIFIDATDEATARWHLFEEAPVLRAQGIRVHDGGAVDAAHMADGP